MDQLNHVNIKQEIDDDQKQVSINNEKNVVAFSKMQIEGSSSRHDNTSPSSIFIKQEIENDEQKEVMNSQCDNAQQQHSVQSCTKVNKKMASIKQLDNPLLLLIFNKLSIQELFPLGRVCVRWKAVRINSARARQELVLWIGKDAQTYIEESGLRIPQSEILVDEIGYALFPKNDKSNAQLQVYEFPLDFARLMYAHFPNLTTLTISICVCTEVIDSIIHLLEQLNRPNGPLHTLKLYSGHDDQDTELNMKHINSYHRLLSVVNSIFSLRKLTFDVNTKFARGSKFARIELSILAKLEEFELNCFRHSIIKFAVDNRRLRSIG